MNYESLNDQELQRLYYHLYRILNINNQIKTELGSLTQSLKIVSPDISTEINTIEVELKKRKLLIDNDLYIVQKNIMKFIQRYWNRNSRSPAIKDIQRNVLNLDNKPISSTSVVYYHLNRLEKMGYIKIQRGTQRGIEIIKRI